MRNMLRWVHDPERLPEGHKGVEPLGAPERGTRLERVGLPSLAILGLLCHLLIFLSLSLTFTETYDPYRQATSLATGWQMLGGGFREIFLLATLILSIFFYLSSLPLFAVKSTWKDALLTASFFFTCLLNAGGFALAFTLTFVWGNPENDTYTTDAAAFIPLVAFSLSFLCSCILLSPSLWRRKERRLRLREKAEEESLTRTLSVTRKQYQQGEAIVFGNVQVNQYGMVDLDNAVTWQQLEDIRLENEVLSLKYEGTWHAWYGTFSLKIHSPRYVYPPDLPVLTALVHEILEKKLDQES